MDNDEYGAAQEQLRLALKALDWKSKVPNEQQNYLVAEVLKHLGFTLDSLELHEQAHTHLQKAHSIFDVNASKAASAGDKQLEISLRSHLASVLNNLSVWHFNASKRFRDSRDALSRQQFSDCLKKAKVLQEDCIAHRKELGQEDTVNMAQALYHLGAILSLSDHRRAALDHTHRFSPACCNLRPLCTCCFAHFDSWLMQGFGNQKTDTGQRASVDHESVRQYGFTHVCRATRL